MCKNLFKPPAQSIVTMFMLKNKKKDVIVVVGPTSVGKSDIAVLIAQYLNGEIISADSRQVYKGLDIGSGKITQKEMQNIPHHGLDITDPQKYYSMKDFQNYAFKKIEEIIKRNKTPIICGGTGFFIQSVINNTLLPEVPPDIKLRQDLHKKNTEELFEILKEKDPKKAQHIDANNPQRLIRAIEIANHLGYVPETKNRETPYDFIQIGLTLPKDELQTRIKQRLSKRLEIGMLQEVENLNKQGITWERLTELGIEYKYSSLYLQKKISKNEMIEMIQIKSIQYAKRQMTWFKKDERITWFNPNEYEKILKLLETKKKERC